MLEVLFDSVAAVEGSGRLRDGSANITAVAETVEPSVVVEVFANAPAGRRVAIGFALITGIRLAGAKAKAAERADADV